MKRTFRQPLLILIAGLVIGLGLFFFRHRPGGDFGATSYHSTPVDRGSVVRVVTAAGALRALNTVTVGSQVSGEIANLHADHNDVVEAGQLLAEIEPATYQARVVQAEADLASADATLELRRVQLRRAAELLAKNLLAVADHDESLAEFRRQEAAAAKARATLESARVDLARTRIIAPISGLVIERSVDRGQTVQASFTSPSLFRLAEDLRRMEITANVSEADIGTVAAGQAVSFTVDAFPDDVFPGEVRQVRNNPSTTQNVVNYPVVISVANAALRLRPGMTAYVTITTGRRDDVLRVPNTALRYRPASAAISSSVEVGAPGIGVLHLPSETKDAPPRRIEVTLGIVDRTYTEILTGPVSSGDLVITGEAVADTARSARNPFLPTPPRR
jgi:HlyD family secretion protein